MKENNKKYETLVIDDTVYETGLTQKFKNKKPYSPPSKTAINAFIPGIIRKLMVKEGDVIDHDSELLILEAMKMENMVTSHLSGRIKRIHVEIGQMVRKGEILLEVE